VRRLVILIFLVSCFRSLGQEVEYKRQEYRIDEMKTSQGWISNDIIRISYPDSAARVYLEIGYNDNYKTNKVVFTRDEIQAVIVGVKRLIEESKVDVSSNFTETFNYYELKENFAVFYHVKNGRLTWYLRLQQHSEIIKENLVIPTTQDERVISLNAFYYYNPDQYVKMVNGSTIIESFENALIAIENVENYSGN